MTDSREIDLTTLGFQPKDVVFVDANTHALNQHILALQRNGFAERATASARSSAIATLDGCFSKSGAIAPRAAASALSEALTRFELELLSVVKRYSPVQWLYHLRQLLHTRAADWRNRNARFSLHACEFFTARAPYSPHNELGDRTGVTFTVTRPVAESLLRLFALAERFVLIDGLRKLAEKGATFTTYPGTWPSHSVPPARDAAIRHYDSRTARFQTPFLGLGTSLRVDADMLKHSQGFLGVASCDPKSIQVRVTPPGYTAAGMAEAFFAPVPLALPDLARICSDRTHSAWDSGHLAAILLLLKLAAHMCFDTHFGEYLLLRFGLIHMPRASFGRWFDAWYPSLAAEVARLFPLATLPPSLNDAVESLAVPTTRVRNLGWGPPVRLSRRYILVDVHAATHAIQHGLIVSGSDEDAKEWRAEHLEHDVQDIVNKAGYAPSKELPHAGMVLKHGRKDVTDIDAIAQFDDKLLIVSCKSFRYTADYHAGKHDEVRNFRERLDKYVSDFDDRLRLLRTHPQGDNYNVRGFTLIGTTCTPFPIYTEDEASSREVLPGLRATVTPGELEFWLKQRRGTASDAPAPHSPPAH